MVGKVTPSANSSSQLDLAQIVLDYIAIFPEPPAATPLPSPSADTLKDSFTMRGTSRLYMQATRALRSNDHPDPKNGVYVEPTTSTHISTQMNLNVMLEE